MKNNDQSRRLVLASGFANDGLWEFVARSGWEFLYIFPPGTAAATEYAWRIDPEHTFHYFECTNYPVEYCLVAGSNPDEMLTKISPQLDHLEVKDIAAAFDRATTPEEKAVTVYALGLAASDEFDEVIFARIVAALHDAHPQVRLAGIDAAFIAGWEALRAELLRVSLNDAEAEVRGTAANALAGLTVRHAGETETQ